MKPIFSIPSHFLLANRPIPAPATYQIKRNVSTIKFRSSFFIYNKINENIRQFNQFLSFFKVIDSDILYISIWFRYFFPSFVSFVWSRVEKLNWLKDFDFPEKKDKMNCLFKSFFLCCLSSFYGKTGDLFNFIDCFWCEDRIDWLDGGSQLTFGGGSISILNFRSNIPHWSTLGT